MSNHNVTQVVRDLGSSVSLLSPDNVTMISWDDLKEIQENTTVQWTPGQMYALVKKKLGKKKVTARRSADISHMFMLSAHCGHLSVQTGVGGGANGP